MENGILTETTDLYFKHEHVAVSVFLVIAVLLSLVGNILVVVISVFYVRLQSLTSIFIRNLALSDLMFTAALPIWVCAVTWRLRVGNALCKVYRFCCSVGFYSNVGFLVLMSVQSYMVLVHRHLGWKKGRSVAEVLICTWVMSVLAALPVTVQIEANPSSGLCTYSSRSAFVALAYKEIVVFVCAFVFMAFLYVRIRQNIFKSTSTRLAFTLAATYFVFWAPYYIVRFLSVLNYHQIALYIGGKHLDDVGYICNILALTRCSYNPLIYGLFGLKFRNMA